jgi:hypothetical protein
MNLYGRIPVSYPSVHEDGSIRIRSGIYLSPREVIATFVPGIRRQ